MTRFKELRRIENAIKHENAAELDWSLGYCRMRLELGVSKHSDKHWGKIEKRVLRAIEALGDES